MNTQAGADGTVGKALDVLDAVAAFGRPVRFGELLAESPHPKATLYRLVQTLTNTGMLAYDTQAQTYAPGLRLVRLAHAAWARSSLAPIASEDLDALAAETGETIHLAQMDAGQVIYVDKRNAATPVEMFSQAGKVGPGYCTGVGKAIMAFLEPDAQDAAIQRQAFFAHTPRTLTTPEALRAELAQIRAEGFAYDREEHEAGIICIAAPILSPPGPSSRGPSSRGPSSRGPSSRGPSSRARVHGALSITTTTARHDLGALDRFRPALTRTATQIAAAVADWQFPT